MTPSCSSSSPTSRASPSIVVTVGTLLLLAVVVVAADASSSSSSLSSSSSSSSSSSPTMPDDLELTATVFCPDNATAAECMGLPPSYVLSGHSWQHYQNGFLAAMRSDYELIGGDPHAVSAPTFMRMLVAFGDGVQRSNVLMLDDASGALSCYTAQSPLGAGLPQDPLAHASACGTVHIDWPASWPSRPRTPAVHGDAYCFTVGAVPSKFVVADGHMVAAIFGEMVQLYSNVWPSVYVPQRFALPPTIACRDMPAMPQRAASSGDDADEQQRSSSDGSSSYAGERVHVAPHLDALSAMGGVGVPASPVSPPSPPSSSTWAPSPPSPVSPPSSLAPSPPAVPPSRRFDAKEQKVSSHWRQRYFE